MNNLEIDCAAFFMKKLLIFLFIFLSLHFGSSDQLVEVKYENERKSWILILNDDLDLSSQASCLSKYLKGCWGDSGKVILQGKDIFVIAFSKDLFDLRSILKRDFQFVIEKAVLHNFSGAEKTKSNFEERTLKHFDIRFKDQCCILLQENQEILDQDYSWVFDGGSSILHGGEKELFIERSSGIKVMRETALTIKKCTIISDNYNAIHLDYGSFLVLEDCTLVVSDFGLDLGSGQLLLKGKFKLINLLIYPHLTTKEINSIDASEIKKHYYDQFNLKRNIPSFSFIPSEKYNLKEVKITLGSYVSMTSRE